MLDAATLCMVCADFLHGSCFVANSCHLHILCASSSCWITRISGQCFMTVVNSQLYYLRSIMTKWLLCYLLDSGGYLIWSTIIYQSGIPDCLRWLSNLITMVEYFNRMLQNNETSMFVSKKMPNVSKQSCNVTNLVDVIFGRYEKCMPLNSVLQQVRVCAPSAFYIIPCEIVQPTGV